MDFHITKRTALLLFFDIAATYAAYWLASLLTDVVGEVFYNNEIYFMLGILALINVLVLGVFHLYNNLWEYASVDEAIQIVLAVALSTLVGAVFLWIIDVRLPIRVFFVALFLLIFFCGGMRMVYRVARRKKRAFTRPEQACDRPRTLIVGAGETGSLTIDRMASKDPLMPGIPLAAVDDDPSKRGLRIHGVKVEGTSDDILELVDKYDIEQIVVAIPSSTLEERKRIFGICTKTDCKLRTLPNIRELRIDELGDVSLRDVDVADLLGREEIVLNTRTVSGYIAGETVLVTGGGGSIGSELARQLCKVAPARIVIFDIYENDAYMLRTSFWPNTTISRSISRSAASATPPASTRCSKNIGRARCSMPPLTSMCRSWRYARARRCRTTCSARSTRFGRPMRTGLPASSSSPPTRP